MDDLFDDSPLGFGIRMITEGKIDPSGTIDNSLGVGEGKETLFSVITTHSAMSDATESQFGRSEMHHRIVDRRATEGDLPQKPFAENRVFGE